MSKFIYQLAFNPNNTSPNVMQTHIFVTQNRDVDSWYLAFPGNYFLKSDKALFDLQGPFVSFFGQTQFTMTYLTPSLIGGFLPPAIWQWVNDLEKPLLPFGT